MNSLDKITYDTLRENLKACVTIGKDAAVVTPDYEIKFFLKGEQVAVTGMMSGIEIQALSDHMKETALALDGRQDKGEEE